MYYVKHIFFMTAYYIFLGIYICVCMLYIYLIYLYTCLHIYIYTTKHVCMCILFTHIYVHTYGYVRACGCVCVLVYAWWAQTGFTDLRDYADDQLNTSFTLDGSKVWDKAVSLCFCVVPTLCSHQHSVTHCCYCTMLHGLSFLTFRNEYLLSEVCSMKIDKMYK